MHEDHEAELRVALLEGLLSSAEAEQLRQEAARLERSPLELLAERGRLSARTLDSLRAAAGLGPPGARAGPELGSTAGPDRTAPEPTGSPTFPVPGWERYLPVRFLGQGGMGRVFLAFDPRLQRNVALKFVRDDSPELVRRFMVEAQAQARVEHECVCKVYEVGEVQGRVYIAMRYVEGRPLQHLVGELTPEQKAVVMARAAEGVHAAHRAGLIHRDLKPSNILVERGEDGQPRPYVMDFGLARDWKEEATATGSVLGTPHYMAPEQARGEVARLDRRADIYSLGATLYALLTGQVPIPGDNNLEVLSRIPTTEPRPPRALDPDIPVDLEAITLKCLEKERSARYDSARALAEDLRRFLDGEPVRARAAGAWYRLRKRARKHWRGLSVAVVALALVAFAGVQAVLARREAGLREHLARRFSELAESVEARARYHALARLHDARSGRQALVATLADIEAEMRQGGEHALGPGHEALGRGWLALGDVARAREHLDTAWERGFHTPRTAYARALVLTRLYQERLQETEPLVPEQRQARRRELARLYRDPALALLQQSAGAQIPSTEYVEALLAFHEERDADALARLDALDARLPWFFEAPLLRGDVLVTRAMRHWDGGRREQAQADVDAARQAYSRAVAIAESLPEAHVALARVEQVSLLMGLYGQGEVLPPLTRGLEALQRALAVSEDSASAWLLRSRLLRLLAEHRTRQGGDAEPPLQEALAAAHKAQALEPARPSARLERALVLWQWARYRQVQGQDPRGPLRQASEAFAQVPPEGRGYDFHTNLGLVFKLWADHEDQLGEDSLSHLGLAIDAYLEAIRLDAHVPDAWINLGNAYARRASNPRAADVGGDLERARHALEKARALNPENVAAHFYEGRLHELRARWLRERGEDARPALDAALASYRRALAINPGLPQIHNGVGLVLLEQAREDWDRAEAPFPRLEQAQAALEQARDTAPQQALAYNNLAEVHAARARYQRARGEDPRPSARAALSAAREALARQPGYALAFISQGEAHQLLAAFLLERGGDPRPALAAAQEALGQALQRNARSAQAWRHLAETRALRARWLARQRRAREESFEEAAQAWRKAIELSPWPSDEKLAFARACEAWASDWSRAGGDARARSKLGLSLVDEVLATRPDWLEARGLRARLQAALEPARPGPAP
jgi:serine/threonine-protein kinase